MKVLVCIPTLTGREHYRSNAIHGYREHNGGHEIVISLEYDAPTCGIGWQRCVERALAIHDDVEFIHFGNDDVVPGRNWLNPLISMAFEHHAIPAPRMEPAGGHIDIQAIIDANEQGRRPPMPPPGDPTCSGGFFYADLPEFQPTKTGQPIDHTALPSCTRQQWDEVGPFAALHFGTDAWFCHRARDAGYPTLAVQESRIYNYAAAHGRNHDGWHEIDFLDFDGTVALPAYERGELQPHERHPLRLTPEGLKLVRDWRMANFDGPHHWEN